MKLWLDDIRPAPIGWWHVKTVEEAKTLLLAGNVEVASLDHDLGACEACLNGVSAEEWLELNEYQSMPHCSHVGTGYDLCVWMAEHNIWPKQVQVHSANPVGRERMEGVIERYMNCN